MRVWDLSQTRIIPVGDLLWSMELVPYSRTLLGILKNEMSFNNLQQLSRIYDLGNGVTIYVQSVFGQDLIKIETPVIAQPIEVLDKKSIIIILYNIFIDIKPKAMPLEISFRSGKKLRSTDLNLDITRYYDSSSLVMLFNPVKKEFTVDSMDKAWEGWDWEGKIYTDNIRSYGVINTELSILKDPTATVEEYIIPAYGTSYSYIPLTGKYAIYKENENYFDSFSESDFRIDIKDIKDMPYALGRNNYSLNNKGELYSYSHSVWKQSKRNLYAGPLSFIPGRYYYRWRNNEGKWIDGGDIGTDEVSFSEDKSNYSGNYKRHIPLATIDREKDIRVIEEADLKREADMDKVSVIGYKYKITRDVEDYCATNLYCPSPKGGPFTRTDNIEGIVATIFSKTWLETEKIITKRLVLDGIEVFNNDYNYLHTENYFSYPLSWGSVSQVSDYSTRGAVLYPGSTDSYYVPCPYDASPYPGIPQTCYSVYPLYNPMKKSLGGSVTAESVTIFNVSTYNGNSKVPYSKAGSTWKDVFGPNLSSTPDDFPTFPIQDPVYGSCLLWSKDVEEESGTKDIIVMDYDSKDSANTYITIYKNSQITTDKQTIRGNYQFYDRPPYDPNKDYSFAEAWNAYIEWAKGQDEVQTGTFNADVVFNVSDYQTMPYVRPENHVPFRIRDNNKTVDTFYLKYKINGIEFDSILISNSTDNKKFNFEVIYTDSSKVGISPIGTGFGNYLIYSSGHKFTWESNAKTEKEGFNIKGVSCQIKDDIIVYTMIIEKPSDDKKEWTFYKRIIGVIEMLQGNKMGNRTEYHIIPDIEDKTINKINKNLTIVEIPDKFIIRGKFSNFNYKDLCSIGVYGEIVKEY